MISSQMMHVDRSDTVAVSAPTVIASSGWLALENSCGDGLTLFPPFDPRDAQVFLTALIERATELREQIAVRLAARPTTS
jgi:hypothetical protein